MLFTNALFCRIVLILLVAKNESEVQLLLINFIHKIVQRERERERGRGRERERDRDKGDDEPPQVR